MRGAERRGSSRWKRGSLVRLSRCLNGALEGARLANNPEGVDTKAQRRDHTCPIPGSAKKPARLAGAMQFREWWNEVLQALQRAGPWRPGQEIWVFILSEMRSLGGKKCSCRHPSHRERLAGQGFLGNAGPTLTSFLAGAAGGRGARGRE